MHSEVPPELAGERADRVVAVVAGVSRSVARSLIESGAATFDGSEVAPRQKVSAGSTLEYEIPETGPRLLPEEVAFGVRYEDDHIVVVDKPAGVVTHPGAGRATGTLASGILHRWPQVRGVGEDDRWGIVHRLDRDTSGLLVVALTRDAFDGLRESMRQRDIARTYLALVHGRPDPPTGTIDAPLGRDPRHPTRFRVDSEGRLARTHFRLAASWSDVSLLEVTLETGRTHQIRVHLGSIGLPVAGDPVYGRFAGAPRVFLHAARLGFEHPIDGNRLEVDSPLPSDLATVVDALGAPVVGAVPTD